MSKQEHDTAERLNAILSRMPDRTREIFLARGEGLAEGYKMGRTDSAAVPTHQEARAGA